MNILGIFLLHFEIFLLYKVCVLFVDWKSKMAATSGYVVLSWDCCKMNLYFFSETANLIKPKLHESSVDGPIQRWPSLQDKVLTLNPMRI
jgi:hypothetical protein